MDAIQRPVDYGTRMFRIRHHNLLKQTILKMDQGQAMCKCA